MKTKSIKIWALCICSFVLSLLWVGSDVQAMGAISTDISANQLSEDVSSPDFSQRFDVTLTPEPTSNVTTVFTTNGECLLGFNNEGFTSGGNVVTKNGSLPFGVQAIDDNDFEGQHSCQIQFSSSSTTDPNYATTVNYLYTFSVADNDQQKTYQFNSQTLSNVTLQEAGNLVERYQIGVSLAPFYPITISAIADSQCDLLAGAAPNQVRTKTVDVVIPSGSTTPVEFSLIPVNDAEFEGSHQCSIEHSVSTTDANYSGQSIPAHNATIIDDEVNPNIPDQREYEGGLIYFADANSDGIQDDIQPQVVSFINSLSGLRQGLVIVDALGNLAEGCSIEGIPLSSELTASVDLSSQMGQLTFNLSCPEDQDYYALWLLDNYYPNALTWLVYGYESDGSLQQLESTSNLFDVGEDVVSALKVRLVDSNSDVTLIQSSDLRAQLSPDQVSGLTNEVGNSGLNPFVVATIIGGAGAIGLVVYRRYFAKVDTTKSNYPRIDRY